ncbi:MAG: hypothetical protein K2G24_08225, partial [Muribaculaceae bacterium]|nr:hypothetical protein [Muribaculaceae bacterium]
MNQFISTLLLLTASAAGIQAQTSDIPPRIQTSAPAEKTAVRAASSDSQKPAATKKIDNRASKVVKSNTKTDSGNIGNHTERPYMA